MERGSFRTSSLCQNLLHWRRSHWTSKRYPVSLVSSHNTRTITHHSMNSPNQRWNAAVTVWVLPCYHKTLKGVNGWHRWENLLHSKKYNLKFSTNKYVLVLFKLELFPSSSFKAFQAGIVWVNCSQPCFSQAPWGGKKRSGFGRELGES